MSSKKPNVKEKQGSYEFKEERFELIEGVRYDMQAAPTIRHQQLVMYLCKKFEDTCAPDGLVLTSPIDVMFDKENECQPDIIYITNENLHIVTEKKIMGAPDIIIEILSPSTSNNDKIRKKAVYERFGVKEYWIADPTHLYVDQFVLTDNKYLLAHTYGNKDTIQSELFSCIKIDLETIFSRLLVFNKE
ncbi:Uma2 family endonuclease [Bacillus sp. 31A1R]|uniref:Uma2 family endonuclease n=1 Tax=Robertmurraya mangrovi TaxID=3098077 RepID=A0ABU5IXX9_9BACI|nr:Uma2 family endonuclease [Bacillus sp. 31A1R]MDZ5471981.1 Uma2 family endonuclease [Bacillus sp. 31A1R]